MIKWKIKEDNYQLYCYKRLFYLDIFNDRGEKVYTYSSRRLGKAIRELKDQLVASKYPKSLDEMLELERESRDEIFHTTIKLVNIYREYEKGVIKNDKNQTSENR